jgi:hypothetical protein
MKRRTIIDLKIEESDAKSLFTDLKALYDAAVTIKLKNAIIKTKIIITTDSTPIFLTAVSVTSPGT